MDNFLGHASSSKGSGIKDLIPKELAKADDIHATVRGCFEIQRGRVHETVVS